MIFMIESKPNGAPESQWTAASGWWYMKVAAENYLADPQRQAKGFDHRVVPYDRIGVSATVQTEPR